MTKKLKEMDVINKDNEIMRKKINELETLQKDKD